MGLELVQTGGWGREETWGTGAWAWGSGFRRTLHSDKAQFLTILPIYIPDNTVILKIRLSGGKKAKLFFSERRFRPLPL